MKWADEDMVIITAVAGSVQEKQVQSSFVTWETAVKETTQQCPRRKVRSRGNCFK